MSRPSVLVDVEELQALRRSRAPLRLLDVRWRLGDPSGPEQFLAGHIPGAIFVDLDRELAAEASPAAGRHPLPSIDQLQAAARRWGLRQGETVVVYDDNASMSAARAWWLLRWAGLESVLLLDGALSAWRATGGELATGPELAEPGDVELSPGHMPTVLIDAVAMLPSNGLLLDARAAERFRGDVEPVDPKAGHIPGAVERADDGQLDRRRPVPPGPRTRGPLLAPRGAGWCGDRCLLRLGRHRGPRDRGAVDRRFPGGPVPGLMVPVEQPRRPSHSHRPLKRPTAPGTGPR